MLRVAVIGAGGYAFALIKTIWQLPEHYELVGVSSRSGMQRPGPQACAERGVPVYPSVDDLLAAISGKCDVVVIPTPIDTHLDLATGCLNAGFDVILEKPPTATIQELDELIATVESSGHQLAVGFQHAHHPSTLAIRRAIDEERYGPVLRVRGMASWIRSDAYFESPAWHGLMTVNGQWVLGGAINNPLAHMLHLQLTYAGADAQIPSQPLDIQAELYRGHPILTEDTSCLKIRTAENVDVLYYATLCGNSRQDPMIAIDCENATLIQENYASATCLHPDGRREVLHDRDDSIKVRPIMMREQHDDFIRRTMPRVNAASCRSFTLAVNGAFESSGMPAQIGPPHAHRVEHEQGMRSEILSINKDLQRAFDAGRLFSEVGLAWAKHSEKFSLENYQQFPSGPHRLEFEKLI